MLRYKESTASIERNPTVHVSVHRVVIGDAQPLMLEGLAQVLRSLGTTPVERCCNGADLLQAIATQRPDLAIMDIRLADPDGLTVLRELKRLGLEIPVILMTGPLQDAEVVEAIQIGIRGLVAKDAPLSAMEHCVRVVLDGGTWLDQGLVGRAMSSLLARETALREFGALLTAREMEVLQIVVAGVRPRDAAARLRVSAGTLKVHLHHIYHKVNVPNRAGLVALARSKGLN